MSQLVPPDDGDDDEGDEEGDADNEGVDDDDSAGAADTAAAGAESFVLVVGEPETPSEIDFNLSLSVLIIII